MSFSLLEDRPTTECLAKSEGHLVYFKVIKKTRCVCACMSSRADVPRYPQRPEEGIGFLELELQMVISLLEIHWEPDLGSLAEQ